MARVDQVQLGMRKIAQIGLRARGDEALVVLAPHDERRKLVFAQYRLPGGVTIDIVLIVLKQLNLDLPVFFGREKAEIAPQESGFMISRRSGGTSRRYCWLMIESAPVRS